MALLLRSASLLTLQAQAARHPSLPPAGASRPSGVCAAPGRGRGPGRGLGPGSGPWLRFAGLGGPAAAVHKVALALHPRRSLRGPAGTRSGAAGGLLPRAPGLPLRTLSGYPKTSRPGQAQLLHPADSKEGCQGCHWCGGTHSPDSSSYRTLGVCRNRSCPELRLTTMDDRTGCWLGTITTRQIPNAKARSLRQVNHHEHPLTHTKENLPLKGTKTKGSLTTQG